MTEESRQRVWLGPPTPQRVAGTPRVAAPEVVVRAHAVDLGVGWFAHADRPGLGGRFDLPAVGRGTMYCANDIEPVVRERLGPAFAGRPYLAASDLSLTAVSEVETGGAGLGRALADALTSRTVTREIGTLPDYALTQAWAAAWDAAGYDGIRYAPRSTPGPEFEAYALFGPAGAVELLGRPVPDWLARLRTRGVVQDRLVKDVTIIE